MKKEKADFMVFVSVADAAATGDKQDFDSHSYSTHTHNNKPYYSCTFLGPLLPTLKCKHITHTPHDPYSMFRFYFGKNWLGKGRQSGTEFHFGSFHLT